MSGTINTIKASYKLKVKDVFVYRGMMILWMLGWVFSFLSMFFLWRSAVITSDLAGYSLKELITYYFLVAFVWAACGWFPYYWIADSIKTGNIIGFVTKPMSFHWHVFASELAWHTVNIIFYGIFLLFIFCLAHNWLILAPPVNLFLFFLALVLAALTIFEFSILMSTAAFWVINYGSLASLFWMSLSLLGGQMLPLAFFPLIWRRIILLLPFRYMSSFPIEVYLGRLTPGEEAAAFLAAGGWVVIFHLLFNFFWKNGLRKYTAFAQ